MRGSQVAVVLLFAAFIALLVLLYPEWLKLADTGPRPEVTSPAIVGSETRAAQTALLTGKSDHKPLEEIWSFRTDHKWQYWDPFLKRAVDQRGGMVCSDIVVFQGRIYFGCEGGLIYCLSPDGALIWSFETLGARTGTPVVTQERLFCGSEDNYLYALDPLTGQQIYRFNAESEVLTTPVLAGDRLIFAARMGRVFALKPDVGGELWTYRHDHLT